MKKLRLNRETIRNLDERDLERVQGGDLHTRPPECKTNEYCTPATTDCPNRTIMPCFVHSMEC